MFSLYIFIKGDSLEEITGYGTIKPRNIISSILGQTPVKSKSLAISNPHDFRQVSSILLKIYIKFLTLNNNVGFVVLFSRFQQLLMLILCQKHVDELDF